MPSRKVQVWFVWFIVSLFYAYQYVVRIVPSVLMQDIVTRFSPSPDSFGQFSGVYYIGYSVMQVPIGILLDRYGPKKILPLFILVTAGGMLPLVTSHSWALSIFGRLLGGVGSAAAVLGVFKVIHLSFDHRKFSRILSFSIILGLLGAIYGGGPVQTLRNEWGFQTVVLAIMALGGILSVLTYLLVPKTEGQKSLQSPWLDVKAVLSDKKVLALCFLGGLMVGPLEGFADIWGVQFLKVTYGLEEKWAAGLPSLIFFGMCVGGPVLSIIAERTQKYIEVVLTCGVLMTLGFAMILTTQLSHYALIPIFFVVGMCSAYQLLVIYKVSTLVKESQTGVATALANMIIMAFGYLFHSIIGTLVGLAMGSAEGTSFDSSSGISIGIAVIPAGLVIGCLGFGYLLFAQSRTRQAVTT